MTREPDHTDDPRGTDTGQAGYPEEQPPGAQPGQPRPRDRDRTEEDGADAPSPSGGDEGTPGQATGNPGAAGG
jgi:hypothetical protein